MSFSAPSHHDDVRGAAAADATSPFQSLHKYSASCLRSLRPMSRFTLLSLVLALLQLIALSYFLQGFFLTRYELTAIQTCRVPETMDYVIEVQERIRREQSGDVVEDGADTVDARSSNSLQPQPDTCWYDRQYDRVVILLIDALRFDFIFFDKNSTTRSVTTSDDDASKPYLNELPILSSLLTSSSDSSYTSLFRFIADPPTVTMQRIKGLTTGGLPTFIDIKNNFGGAQITEDNWLRQMSRRSKKSRTTGNAQSNSPASSSNHNIVHFFGDDTWFDLYPPPTHFSPQSRAYPSFNVKDLHTVDDGCWTNLEPILEKEMERLVKEKERIGSRDSSYVTSDPADEWDLILSHFLGVDHVGHRYGPNHEEMRHKLQQMNRIITKNVEYIRMQRDVNQAIRKSSSSSAQPQEVLFLVLGDHGMTEDGNHGGQTPEEIYSGLFMYSTKRISSGSNERSEGRILEELRGRVLADSTKRSSPSSQQSQLAIPPLSPSFTSFMSIPQIDIVPTLSLLLGQPIPFGNLGKVIPEIFWGRRSDDEDDQLEKQVTGEDSSKRVTLIHRIFSMQPLLQSLRLNALQIFQYLHVYSTVISPSTFSERDLEQLNQDFAVGEAGWKELAQLTKDSLITSSLSQLRTTEQLYISSLRGYYSYLHSSSELAKSRWTTFDYTSMYEGITLSCTIVGVVALLVWRRQQDEQDEPSSTSLLFLHHIFLSTLYIPFLYILAAIPILPFVYLKGHELFLFCLGALLSFVLRYTLRVKGARSLHQTLQSFLPSSTSISFQSYISLLLTAITVQGQFSNVFIENESSTAMYSCCIILCSWVYTGSGSEVGRRKKRSVKEKQEDDESEDEHLATSTNTSPDLSFLWCFLGLMSIKLMTYASYSTSPDATYQDRNKYSESEVTWMIASLIALPIISIVIAAYLMKSLEKWIQTSKRMKLFAILHYIIVPLSFVCIFIFWSLHSSTSTAAAASGTSTSPSSSSSSFLSQLINSVLSVFGLADSQPWFIRIGAPRLVFSLTLLGILAIFTFPPHQFLTKQNKNSDNESVNRLNGHRKGDSSYDNSSQETVRRRKENGADASNGVASTHDSSSSFEFLRDDTTLLTLQLHTLFTLLSLPMLLVLGPKSSVVYLSLWCLMISVSKLIQRTNDASSSLTYSQLLFFLYFSLHLSYSTGHANSFSSLQVSCAFIGFDVFQYYVGAALLILNTYGNVLITCVIAMIVVAWKSRHDARRAKIGTTSSSSPASSATASRLRFLLVWFIFLVACRTMLSTVNVYIQRRHLMVWAIFAPKYMFDGLYNLAIGACTTLLAASIARWTK